MRDIVLFDMDGTLTPPRKKIEREVITKLKELSQHADIGIVTGSGYDYLFQQCRDIWFDIGSVRPTLITLFPCNGTQVYKWGGKKFESTYSASMAKFLGETNFDILMRALVHAQFQYVVKDPEHPLTGHFISCRGSLVNWCPVGRNANDSQRKMFVDYDQKTGVRESMKSMIEKYLFVNEIENVTLALGGSTSIDIFPTGWDKTYCLRHIEDRNYWFIGDSCTGNGNDRTLYEAASFLERGFSTESPQETLTIIDSIISSITNGQSM